MFSKFVKYIFAGEGAPFAFYLPHLIAEVVWLKLTELGTILRALYAIAYLTHTAILDVTFIVFFYCTDEEPRPYRS